MKNKSPIISLFLRSLLAMVLWMLTPSLSQAATLKVEKLGGTPYSTIQAAINDAGIGDTIEVGPGSYDETVTINISVNLIGIAPQHVLIKGSATGQGIVVSANVTTTIKNFTITSRTSHGIEILPSSTVSVSHCIIASTGACGIYAQTNEGRFSGQHPKIILDHITVSRTFWTGILVHAFNGEGHALTLLNSIVHENARDQTAPFNISLYTGHTIRNVLLVGKGTERTSIINTISGDPRFTDSTNFVFTLRPGSPAINAGITTPGVMDPDGTPVDLGAYGGPEAASFWPYQKDGPLIKNVVVTQPSIPQGGKLTIKASATTR